MRALSLLALGALSFAGCVNSNSWTKPPGQHGADSGPVRLVAIPQEENGYHCFQSQVIRSRAELDDLIAESEAPRSWNDRAGFLAAIEHAHIDFAQESLVLIRQGDGSGSDTVTLAEPRLHGGTLTCTVHIHHPGSHTRDMQYRCFAVVVQKNHVRQVDVRVRQGWTSELQETLVVTKSSGKLD